MRYVPKPPGVMSQRALWDAVNRTELISNPPADAGPGYTICEVCGKRSYKAKADANRVRAKLRNRARVYRCSSGGWHISGIEKFGRSRERRVISGLTYTPDYVSRKLDPK